MFLFSEDMRVAVLVILGLGGMVVPIKQLFAVMNGRIAGDIFTQRDLRGLYSGCF